MLGYSLFPLTFLHNTYHFSLFWCFFFFPAEAECLAYNKHKCLVHTVGTQRVLWDEWLRYNDKLPPQCIQKGLNIWLLVLSIWGARVGVGIWSDVVKSDLLCVCLGKLARILAEMLHDVSFPSLILILWLVQECVWWLSSEDGKGSNC